MRRYPLPTIAIIVSWTATVLVSAYVATPVVEAREPQRVNERHLYRSPDRSLIATVVTVKQLRPYGGNPSRLEIRSANGHLLASRDHSEFPNQGYVIDRAAWTADSSFFIYMVSEAGGHSPWHHPMFFYSRRRHHVYSLDKALEGVITGDMELRPPSIVLTSGRYDGGNRIYLRFGVNPTDDMEKQLQINLQRLELHLKASALSTDANDKKQEAKEEEADR